MKKIILSGLLIMTMNSFAEEPNNLKIPVDEKKEVKGDESFNELKDTGAKFWGSLKKYSSEKYDDAKTYTVDKYNKITNEGNNTRKEDSIKKEEDIEKNKVSINDDEYKLVNNKEASKKPEPSTWQKFRIWLDPDKQNIRKGEKD